MIEKIVEQINENIAALLRLKSGENVSFKSIGIASPIQVQHQEPAKNIPAVVLSGGSCEPVFSTDEFSAGWYHRISSKSYGSLSGYGDNERDVETAEMFLVVWGCSDKLNMSNLQFEREVIIPAIPQGAQLVSTDFDAYSIASSEFKNTGCRNKPKEFIFSVAYSVQYVFERKQPKTIKLNN